MAAGQRTCTLDPSRDDEIAGLDVSREQYQHSPFNLKFGLSAIVAVAVAVAVAVPVPVGVQAEAWRKGAWH